VNLFGLKRVVNMKLHYFEWSPQILPTPNKNPAFPMIFLHGMGGTGSIWRPITAKLEDQFKCIALDQRGHGLSRPVPASEPGFHADDYARDVIETLDEIGIDRFFLIGHSMGVRTALDVARQIPKRVIGLVAVDIGISSAWGGGIGLPLASFMEALPSTFPNRSDLKNYVFEHCPDPAIAQYLTAVSKKISDAPETWNFPFDHEALVKTIHQANEAQLDQWVPDALNAGVSMTFLRGENSKVWLKHDYEAQRAKFVHPLLKFEEWENCGHGLPFEQRVRFVLFLESFVKRLTDQSE
jgi:pimeloyl-ACP methyl ester carboxylesterase